MDRGASRTFLSLVAGVIAGGLAFILLALLFFSLGLFGWTDGGAKEEIQRLQSNMAISLLLMTSIGSFIAGLVTTFTSMAKNVKNAAICGVILLLIYLGAHNFSFAHFESLEAISVWLILPFTILGGWTIIPHNKKKQSNL